MFSLISFYFLLISTCFDMSVIDLSKNLYNIILSQSRCNGVVTFVAKSAKCFIFSNLVFVFKRHSQRGWRNFCLLVYVWQFSTAGACLRRAHVWLTLPFTFVIKSSDSIRCNLNLISLVRLHPNRNNIPLNIESHWADYNLNRPTSPRIFNLIGLITA